MCSSITPKLNSLIVMIGPPRSGTTLIANSVMAHSTVTGVMEPFQRRRYDEKAPGDLTEILTHEGVVDFESRTNLVVKETTTRLDNVDRSIALLQEARAADVYTGLVMLLRCPFTAYLSQVEASQKFWKEKKMIEESEESFLIWCDKLRTNLKQVCLHARSQHFRIVSYESFCDSPRAELSRIMALIPERTEDDQLSFRVSDTIKGAADPKVHEKSGGIHVTDRSDEINEIKSKYADIRQSNFLNELRTIVLENIGHESDRITLDRVSRLVLK